LITDDKIHALVGYGKHGKYEDIQDLICGVFYKRKSAHFEKTDIKIINEKGTTL